MKGIKKGIAILLVFCTLLGMVAMTGAAAPQTEDAAEPMAADDFYKIVHLDCGREYFPKDWIVALLHEMKAAGYNQLQLAFGNGGFRFYLNDMSVGTYSSENVRNAVEAGNAHYNAYGDGENGPTNGEWISYAPTVNALTETEMDSIIATAKDLGIEIVPMFNTPGHMHALLSAMQMLGMSNVAVSNGCMNLNNEDAVQFTKGLYTKYVDYFKEKSCRFFSIGADEYSTWSGTFYDYANSLIEIVKAAGMTPRVFNDSFRAADPLAVDSTQKLTQVCYWYGNKDHKNASDVRMQGYSLINTNHDYYYVSTNESWNLSSEGYTFVGVYNESTWISKAEKFSNTAFYGGNVSDPAGSMFCIWCNTPGKNDPTAIAQQIRMILRVMGARMNERTDYSVSSVTVSGGFNADGTIHTASGGTDVDLKNETINVTVSGTATVTQENVNNASQVDKTELDNSIAMVDVTGKDSIAEEITEKINYNQVNNIKCSDLLSSDKSVWTRAGDYYYTPDQTNYYPLYAMRSTSWTSSYTWGYKNGDGFVQIGQQNVFLPVSLYSPNITVYSQTKTTITTPAVPASTTIMFTGRAVGTTYVTIGDTKYTIHVTAESLSDKTLDVNFWITNTGVKPDGWTAGTDYTAQQTSDNLISYKTITAEITTSGGDRAYSESGIVLSDILPTKEGTAVSWNKQTYDVVYSKSAYLPAADRQTTDGWTNHYNDGDEFQYLRYWNGTWAYSSDRTNWTPVSNVSATASGKNQIVLWYRQKTTVTEEIETQIVDWGPISYTQESQQLLDFAVRYETGERVPDTFPQSGKTIGFDMAPSGNQTYYGMTDGIPYRIVYGIAGLETSNYEVYMITLTPTSNAITDTISRVGNYSYNGTEKAIWVAAENDLPADMQSYQNDPFYGDMVVGGEPNVSKIHIYRNQGIRVTYYVRAKVTEDSLTVRYVDQTANSEFYSYNIAVAKGTLFDRNIALADPWKANLNNGSVTNLQNKTQTVSADLATMPAIGANYRYSDYTCVRVDRSTDGKEVTLYYTFNNTKSYVVDFGLPLVITSADLGLPEGGWISSAVSGAQYGSAVAGNGALTYTPRQTLKGVETLQLTLTGKNEAGVESTVTHQIYIYPATTVYYEETFATNHDDWESSTAVTGTQRASSAGSKANYGYDSAYDNVLADNGCITGVPGDATASFSFTGTGVTVYANCTQNTGTVMVALLQNGSVKKLVTVDTRMKDGDSEATAGQAVNAYNVPIVSLTGLARGEYEVQLKPVLTKNDDGKVAWPVSIDGFRVFGTLDVDHTQAYGDDGEASPVYGELRNAVLAGLSVSADVSTDYAEQIALNAMSQVYATAEGSNGALIVEKDGNGDGGITVQNPQDLLDNGPKNELYLQPGQSVVFKLAAGYQNAQVGLKALNAAVKYMINGASKDLASGTDMFYPVGNTGTVTITNTGNGVLSITLVKAFRSDVQATAMFAPLTADDLVPALMSLGYKTEPVQADAVLTIAVQAGSQTLTTTLTASGTEGESHTFTAAEIRAAAEQVALPEGYTLDGVTFEDVTVQYGVQGGTSVQAAQTQAPTPEPQPTLAERIMALAKELVRRFLSGWHFGA